MVSTGLTTKPWFITEIHCTLLHIKNKHGSVEPPLNYLAVESTLNLLRESDWPRHLWLNWVIPCAGVKEEVLLRIPTFYWMINNNRSLTILSTTITCTHKLYDLLHSMYVIHILYVLHCTVLVENLINYHFFKTL